MNLERTSIFRQQCHIGGQWVDASDQETIPVVNPANDFVIGHAPRLTAEDVQSAIRAADRALPPSREMSAKAAFAEIVAKGVILHTVRPYIESRDNSGFRFSIANALENMSYYMTMAQESSAMHGTAGAIRQTYANFSKEGPAQSTVPELITILADTQSRVTVSESEVHA
jgi:3-hydroxyisobutyrate dehydrogenase-like beta-hydroxyacid dehydrogenase